MANSVNLMGEEVFVTTPLYRRSDMLDVVYINQRLYEQLFNEPFEYERAKQRIISMFSVTIDKDRSLEEMDECAYIDYQKDPTDIAMNGNLGSGRAFYLYEDFNIKGEKTPLAISPYPDYNNGKYSMEASIEEALISEVASARLTTETFGTLAILDTHEDFKFPYVDEILPCSMMVRHAPDCTLYRISHLFVNHKPLSREEILTLARTLGRLEGDKFIERFLHGAWSIGNISIKGNMIDLDTSFFTKYRNPVWSYTNKYKTNFFGYENEAELKILQIILDSELNKDGVEEDEIGKILDSERLNTIHSRFPYLLGIDNSIYLKYKDRFDALCDEFIRLSRLMFGNYMDLSVVDPNVNQTALFDFSAFFREYELLKQSGKYNDSKALTVLTNNTAFEKEYTVDDDELKTRIHSFFESSIIGDIKDYMLAVKTAVKFIREFDLLMDEISKNEKIDQKKKLVDSYLRNSDLDYLTGRKWLRGELIYIYKKYGGKVSSEYINLINEIYSGKKNYANLTVFEEGIMYLVVDEKGVKVRFRINGEIEHQFVHLFINGKRKKYNWVSSNELESEYFPHELLLSINPTVKIDGRDLTKEGMEDRIKKSENKKMLFTY